MNWLPLISDLSQTENLYHILMLYFYSGRRHFSNKQDLFEAIKYAESNLLPATTPELSSWCRKEII